MGTITDKNLILYDEVVKRSRELYKKKNETYGDSFTLSLKRFGLMPAITRIDDKWNRILNIMEGNPNLIPDETIKDNFEDILNYCIMTLMAIMNNELGETFNENN